MPPVGPELAVRLSAQGVQDVVNAFARVRSEGKKTGSETAAGLNLINQQITSLTGLLPILSAGLVTAKLGQLILSTRETTENIGKLSEKTGAGVGTLSALALSAHDSEVSMEDLSKGMVKLAKAQQSATTGNKDTQKAFSSLGITIKDLNTLNPGDLFVKVAQAMAALPPGADRTATALKLFGKAGADLIPMLDALGTDGFDQAVEKAKRLGLFLDDDLVNSSRAAQDALHELEDIAAGLATRFNAGFMPNFTAGVEVFAETITGEGVDSVQRLGDVLGKTFAYAASGMEVVKNNIVAGFHEILAEAQYLWAQTKALASIISTPTSAGLSSGLAASNQADIDLQQRLKSIQQQRNSNNNFAGYKIDQALDSARNRKPTSYPRGGGADGDGESDADKKKAQNEAAKLQKSYVDMVQARADNEIAILKAMNSAEEAEDKRKYEAGLLSLDDYYDRRAKRIDQAYDEEYAQLQAKEAAALALPGQTPEQENKRTQDVEKIRAQEYELSLKRQSDLAALEDERTKARTDAAQKQLANEQKLATMTGNRSEAARLALEQELNEYALLLQKQGQSTEEIQKATAAYRERAQAKIDFGDSAQAGNSALGALGLGVQGIQDAQGSGAISQISATAQIVKLQQQQLPLLKQIGDQMLINAIVSDDPQLVDQALAYNAQLVSMQAKLHNVKTAATEFTDVLTTQGMGAFTDFFSDIASGTKTAGDAFNDLATTFEKAIGRMISQMFVYYALSALVGWIAPNSSLATSLTKAGPFGSLTGFDDGGWTGGKRGQVSGVVHGEEFVVKAGPAAANRSTLEAMNAGLSPASVMTRSDYATPMPAATAAVDASSLAPVINITTPSGTQAQSSQRTGQNGQSITDIIITTVATDIARGGKVAQAQQSTFGLTRRGNGKL